MTTLDDILAGLGAASWRTRKDAAGAAAAWPRRDEVLPALVALLDPDADVAARSAAVEALARMGAPAVPALVAVVETRGPARKFAIDALAAMRPSEARGAATALVACLDEPDENVRAAAAEALGGLGARAGAPAVEALRRQLGGGALATRLTVLEALVALDARLPLPEVVPLLDEPLLQPAALALAGRTGDLEALPHLLDALAGPHGAAAMGALVVLHDGQTASGARARIEASLRAAAVAPVVDALQMDPTPVRRAAARVAGWARAVEALPALCAALVDDETHDAAAAAIAAVGPFAVAPLVELGRVAGPALRREILAVFPRLGAAAADARVAEVCARALGDDEAPVAAAAARTLGEIGGKDALGPLLQALGRAGEVGAAAGGALAALARRWPDEVALLTGSRSLDAPLCRVLGALGLPADRARLLGALRDGDPPLRRAAAAALGEHARGGPEVAGALTYALADDDPGVRAAAAASLGALGAREAAPALTGACRDPDPAAAVAATRALGRLREGGSAQTLRALAGAGGLVAFAAVEAVAPPPDPADDDLLASALARSDPEVAKAAARALADRPRPGPRAALAAALDHPRWDVRRAAAQALARHPSSPEIAAALRARAAVEHDALVAEALEAALS